MVTTCPKIAHDSAGFQIASFWDNALAESSGTSPSHEAHLQPAPVRVFNNSATAVSNFDVFPVKVETSTQMLVVGGSWVPCFSKETTSISKPDREQLNYKDFIDIQNVPKYAANADISVEYKCTKPCTIHVDIIASSEFRTGILVFKKRWKNKEGLVERRRRTVSLKFPSIMVYRTDFFQKHSISVYFTVVRAWVVHTDMINTNAKYNESILNAAADAFALLEPILPAHRPYKDHQRCFTWFFDVMWKTREVTESVCPFETDTVRVLDFPLASSSEHNGLVITFDKFRNRELEQRRQELVNNNPIFTLSIWMYLLDYCSSKECGIIHHIDWGKMYATPLLFLNDKGQIHVQMHLITGIDVAMLANLQLPLFSWFRLDMTVYGRQIVLAAHVGGHLKSHGYEVFNLAEDMYFDDTAGYMVLGGSKNVLGIEGYFGPIKYYRLKALKTQEITNPLSKDEIYQQIADHYQRCVNAQDIARIYTRLVGEMEEMQSESTSRNDYMALYYKYGGKTTCRALPWEQEEIHQFSSLFNFLKTTDVTSSDPNNMLIEFGRKMYEGAVEKMSHGLHHLGDTVTSLEDASCLGYHKASYLLAVMYEMGLGISVSSAKGLLFSLVGAQGSDRLALLKLGYKHFQGIDNYPLDFGISYAYYFSVAKKTPKDRWTNHEQAFVETIRLMDDDMLKEQTRENDDLFLWLKQNAERGDTHAQHRLAQMLFWGQQGVTKNVQAAVVWYEKGALEDNNPLLIYDYAILLFKGTGVPKNRKLALKLMKKSAAQGQHEALNGLGWYYHSFKKDYDKAAKYWKKAYSMGNADAAFNLGVMHLNGKHPGEVMINETRAFELITTASEGGHIEATITLAQYLITGGLNGVPRDPEKAISWAKIVAEQNGLIGHVIRKALNAYLDGFQNEALLYYTLAAEAGIEVAQTNVAYLCEESPKLTTVFLKDTCVWRYYNFSVYQNNPPSFALLKMGDLYYFGSTNRSRDVEKSALLYMHAAQQGDAQGYFNLAQLIQEGISVPKYLLQHLQIDKSVYSKNESLAVELYERCQTLSSDEAINPCSLVLLYLHMNAAWTSIVHSFLVYVLGSLLLSVAVATVVRFIHAMKGSSEYSTNLPNTEQGEPSASGAQHSET
ncbi:protein sel-1 homolog 3 [Pelodytes ibericus]